MLLFASDNVRFPLALIRAHRALKIDFAPALVGFELAAGGRMVPKTDGVVVCEVRRGRRGQGCDRWVLGTSCVV